MKDPRWKEDFFERVFAVVRGVVPDARYPPVDNGRLRDQRLRLCALYRPGL